MSPIPVAAIYTKDGVRYPAVVRVHAQSLEDARRMTRIHLECIALCDEGSVEFPTLDNLPDCFMRRWFMKQGVRN